MQFRPCIDLRNGKVTQIVGSTLRDSQPINSSQTDINKENFVDEENKSSYYAELYKKHGLSGGHIIMLGPGNEDAARLALQTYHQQMQIGGGIDEQNAQQWLDAGASHVIVTSSIFHDSELNISRLQALVAAIGGKQKLVIDLSCRKRRDEIDGQGGHYYVVTDRWQRYSSLAISLETFTLLAPYCDEFLIHGVDVEGKKQGIEEELLSTLYTIIQEYKQQHPSAASLVLTYAGGVRHMQDIDRIAELGHGLIHFSIGSALSIFGGDLSFDEVVNKYGQYRNKTSVDG